MRVDDISAAVDYLTTLAEVDPEHIGVLGICAGGGYAAAAAMMDTRLKAIGTVSAVNYGQMYRQGWDKRGTPTECLALRDLAMAARTAEATGAAIQYLPTTPLSREQESSFIRIGRKPSITTVRHGPGMTTPRVGSPPAAWPSW